MQITRAIVTHHLTRLPLAQKRNLIKHFAGDYSSAPFLAMRMGESPPTYPTHTFKQSIDNAKRAGVRLYGPKILAVPGELSAGEYEYCARMIGKFLAHCDEGREPSYGTIVKSGSFSQLDFVWRRAAADGMLEYPVP